MDTKFGAYEKVQKMNLSFEEIHGTSICAELLEKHATQAEIAQRAHHEIICRKAVGDVAELLFDMIKTTDC